jgi:hypothetical protein
MSTKYRLVVSITVQPDYPKEKNLKYMFSGFHVVDYEDDTTQAFLTVTVSDDMASAVGLLVTMT